MTVDAVRRLVYRYYALFGRNFPWRGTGNPYYVYLSEVMLQQTTATRVVEKYKLFLRRFPTVESIASSGFAEIIEVWQGLGYNRRALYLHRAMRIIAETYGGEIPNRVKDLEALPGIGKNTARSILAFAYNRPVVFIETNIRTAMIYHFFRDCHTVHDRDIMPCVEKTLDRVHPARWYNALMDYGSAVKRCRMNPGRSSAHYSRQSPFEGSHRQVRGMILKICARGPVDKDTLAETIHVDATRIECAIEDLKKEGFIAINEGKVGIVS